MPVLASEREKVVERVVDDRTKEVSKRRGQCGVEVEIGEQSTKDQVLTSDRDQSDENVFEKLETSVFRHGSSRLYSLLLFISTATVNQSWQPINLVYRLWLPMIIGQTQVDTVIPVLSEVVPEFQAKAEGQAL